MIGPIGVFGFECNRLFTSVVLPLSDKARLTLVVFVSNRRDDEWPHPLSLVLRCRAAAHKITE